MHAKQSIFRAQINKGYRALLRGSECVVFGARMDGPETLSVVSWIHKFAWGGRLVVVVVVVVVGLLVVVVLVGFGVVTEDIVMAALEAWGRGVVAINGDGGGRV